MFEFFSWPLRAVKVAEPKREPDPPRVCRTCHSLNCTEPGESHAAKARRLTRFGCAECRPHGIADDYESERDIEIGAGVAALLRLVREDGSAGGRGVCFTYLHELIAFGAMAANAAAAEADPDASEADRAYFARLHEAAKVVRDAVARTLGDRGGMSFPIGWFAAWLDRHDGVVSPAGWAIESRKEPRSTRYWRLVEADEREENDR